MSGAFLFLLRKDPALKGLAASVPILTGIGLAIRFSAGDQLRRLAEPAWSGFAIFMFMVIWGVTLFHTAGTGFWSRSSRIAMVLPIPARELWLIRTLAVAAAVLIPLAGMTAALAVGVDRFLFLLGAKVMAVVLFLLAVGRSPYPKLARVPVSAVYVVFLVFISILALIYLLISPVTPATVLIPAALAVLITLQSYLAVPRGFLAAPDRPGQSEGSFWWGWLEPPDLQEEPAGADAVKPEPAAETPPPAPAMTFRQVLHWTLFRTLVNRLHVWLFGIVLVLIGMGIVYEFFEGQGNWIPLCYTPLWFLAHMQNSPKWIGSLAPLPISRNLIFRYVAGSLLLPFLVGSMFGMLLVQADRPTLVVVDTEEEVQLKVPFEFWELSRAGESPVATAPWGERLVLPAHRIDPWSGRNAFNPYAVTAESSDRFVAWQEARANQAVYGQATGGRSRLHNRTWGLGFLTLGLLLVAGLVLCLRQPRRRIGRVLHAAMIPTLGSLVGLAVVAMVVGPYFQVTSREGLDAIPLIFMGRVAGSLAIPGGAYLVVIVAVLIAGWFLVRRAFRKVEPDPTPTKTIADDYRF